MKRLLVASLSSAVLAGGFLMAEASARPPAARAKTPLPSAASPGKGRDPKRPDAELDRRAANVYMRLMGRIPSQHFTPGFMKGVCKEAPDDEQRNFCEGNWKALRDPNLAALGYGTSDAACNRITHPDLRNYCIATWDKYAWSSYCTAIKDPNMRLFCEMRNKKYPPAVPGGGGGYGGSYTAAPAPAATPAPAPAETPAPAPHRCRPNGAIVRSANDCCSGTAEYAPNASNADRADGREKQCIP